jgi:mono/diheme cytochrome c family protein
MAGRVRIELLEGAKHAALAQVERRREMTNRQGITFKSGMVALAALLALLALGATGFTQREQEWMADRNYMIVPIEGSEIFKEYCASCHGMDATGNGPAALALRKAVPDLTRIAERNGGRFPTGTVKEYVSGESDIIAHGSREMPIWGPVFRQVDRDYELGQIRLHNVTVYLESLQKKVVPASGK